MEDTNYFSGVYELNKETKYGQKVFGHPLLPNSISFKDLTKLMVSAQKICFNASNRGGSNTKRIMNILKSTRKDEYDSPTLAVCISVHLDDNLLDVEDGELKYSVSSLFNYDDIGILTIQLANIHLMSDGVIVDSNRDGYWIHEVCKHTKDIGKVEGKTPIPNIMKNAEQYILHNGGNQSYLLVEKGSGSEKLLKIYGVGYYSETKKTFVKGYNYEIIAEDSGYYYMKKELDELSGGRKKKPLKRKTRKRRYTRNRRKTRAGKR